MDKLKTIIITVGLLWLFAFCSAKLIDNGNVVGSGIAIVPIGGTITIGGGGNIFQDGTSSDVILGNLRKAEKDNGIKAIVLEINSGGGAVVASKEIADAVKEIEKPVVAWIREVGASGAYWVASSSDWVVADELSITGSVGVLSSYLELSGFLEKYNVTYQRLTAGEYKDVGDPYREMKSDERVLLQKKLDLIHSIFIEDVVENRGLNDVQKNEISTGAFYLGIEGMELGLIDEFGGRKEAILKAKKLGGLKDGKVVEFKDKVGLFDLLEKIQSKAFYSAGRGIGDSFVEEGFEIIV